MPADESGYQLRDAVGVQEGEGWDDELEKVVAKAAHELMCHRRLVRAQAEYERQQAAVQATESAGRSLRVLGGASTRRGWGRRACLARVGTGVWA